MKTTHLFTLIVTLALAPDLSAQTATQVWANLYNPSYGDVDYASAVAVDSGGNIVVTGESLANGSSIDYYTAKYAANGPLIWERRYNGPFSGNDQAHSVAVDSLGNVAVTGQSDSGGSHDCYTAKYASVDGMLLWENRRIAPASGFGNAVGFSVAVDNGGNVVVTGSVGNSDGCACFTAKYAAANGALIWEKLYNGSAAYIYNTGFCVALDSAGNVAITGRSSRDGIVGFIGDFYTAKYASADGMLLWERRYNGTADRDDVAYGVVVDGLGNVLVTGRSQNANNYDYYTAKYAAEDGALLWERRYNGLAGRDDFAYSVAVDGAGNVAVTGESRNSVSTSSGDYYTAKYASADGALLWEKRYNGPANGSDAAFSVAADSAGNVVVTGQSLGSGTGTDFYTTKYAATDGHLLWEARYDGLVYGNDIMDNKFSPLAGKLALTPDGGAVVCGRSNDRGGGAEFTTVRYALPEGDADGDGLQDWWEGMWWGTTVGHTAFDDFDRDGVPELIEMAFGLNPKQPDNNALPQPFVEGGYLTITITNHPGVTYEVQSAGTPDAPAFSAATTTWLVANATTLKVRDNFPITASATRYLRVKVTAAP